MWQRIWKRVGPLCALLALGLVATAQVGHFSPELERIVGSALGDSPLAENLRILTDEIGGRRTTSPEMARAVTWATEAFRAAGVDEVHTETFTMPNSWAGGRASLEILSPQTQAVKIVSIGWSPATPEGGLVAEVVDVGEGGDQDFARAGQKVRGALVLVHTPAISTWPGLFAEYEIVEAASPRARKHGAAGILWLSSRWKKQMYRRPTGLAGGVGSVPEAIIAREDGLRLARLLEAGKRVRARLTLENRVGGPYEERNVVAEIRGAEKPEEVVILGAHLDSWDLGTGALDNGANSALVIDVARALRAAGRRPKRTVRFVLFSGEEQGMVGSMAYVKAHQAEMDRIAAVVIYDTGIGRITGYSLGGREDIRAGVEELLQPVRAWGSNTHTADAFAGTDNFDFLLEGVPTLVAWMEEANYIDNYHADSDTLDKIDLRELKLHAAFAAATVWGIADRAERLGKRQTRAEIEELMKKTTLDQAMKALGIWEGWASGERGRRP